jgi:hypothetical protein
MPGPPETFDQATVQTFVGEKPHAASGCPNWMSSLRR